MTRPYKTRERGPVITCCGVEVYDDLTGHHWHNKSVLHRNYKRIVRSLEKNCMTFTEIGLRVGVSRERIRQIAGMLNERKGMERQKACSLTQRDGRWRERLRTSGLGRFIKEVESRGLGWDRVPSVKGNWWNTSVQVEGQRVKIAKSCRSAAGFIQIHKGNPNVDITAYELPNNEGWLLVPLARRITPTSTLFALHPNLDGVGISEGKRHDYHLMVNDWDVFKQSKSASRAA